MKNEIVIAGIILATGMLIAGAIVWANGGLGGAAAETYLDVRTDAEWEAGHVSGAVLLDVEKIKTGALPDLPKDAPITIYCRTGHRAGEALDILKSKGYTRVRNAGGLEGLKGQGVKTCTGKEAACN